MLFCRIYDISRYIYSNLIYTKQTEIYSGFRRTLQIQATTFESGDIIRQTRPDNFETDLSSK